MSYIKEKQGEPFLLKHEDFCKVAGCVITSIILNKQYSFHDEELITFIEEISKIYDNIGDVSTFRECYSAFFYKTNTYDSIVLVYIFNVLH